VGEEVPSGVEVEVGRLAEGSKPLLDLVINFDVLPLVLPFGEFGLVELLLEFGLHRRDLLLGRPALVDELLRSARWASQHSMLQKYIYNEIKRHYFNYPSKPIVYRERGEH
jgi:hypothetical protein